MAREVVKGPAIARPNRMATPGWQKRRVTRDKSRGSLTPLLSILQPPWKLTLRFDIPSLRSSRRKDGARKRTLVAGPSRSRSNGPTLKHPLAAVDGNDDPNQGE